MALYGNCYYASEALYHILGGKKAGWKPMRVTVFRDGDSETHWFIKHSSGLIIDPSKRQFNKRGWWRKPDYSKAVGSGFLTSGPSKHAKELMKTLTWQEY